MPGNSNGRGQTKSSSLNPGIKLLSCGKHGV